MSREWIKLTEKLPSKLIIVQVQHKSSPRFCIGGQKYYFDPSDNTFRTPKWKNVTKRVYAWIEK